MRRQLILLLFGFTALLSFLFSAVVLIVYFRVEDNIFAGQLEKVLHSYRADPAAFVSAPRTLEGHILHVGPLEALPQDLRPLIENTGPGYHEIELKDQEFHLLAQPQPPGEQLLYVVAQIDEDETHETRLQIALLVGMVATLASAVFLGRLIARRTVSPVERLSDIVQKPVHPA